MAPFLIPYPKRTTPKFLADKTQASLGVEDMGLAYIFLSWWLWVDLVSGVNLAGPVGRTSSAQQLLFLRRLCPSCCVGWSSGWPEPRLVQQNLLLSGPPFTATSPFKISSETRNQTCLLGMKFKFRGRIIREFELGDKFVLL